MKTFLPFLFALLIVPFDMLGQDVHFSQALSAPLIFNPASTGDFYGSWRVNHNFRTQWKAISDPFNTLALSFDKTIKLRNRKIFVGIYLLDDRSGVIGLHKSGLMLSGAYQFLLPKGIIRVGAQGGFFNLSYDLNGATVPKQFDEATGYFNAALPYYEPNLGESSLYADFNAGLVYKVMLGHSNTELGFATFHINKANNSFFESNELDMAYKSHFKIKFPINEKIQVEPSGYFISMAHANNLLLGGNLSLDVPQNRYRIHSIYAGPYLRTGFDRNTDAFILMVGAKLFQLVVGLSYDVNISDLDAYTHHRGAFEISISYTGIGKQINPATIPCFRQ